MRHQVYLSASDSIKAKIHYTHEYTERGVKVKYSHTENGVFNYNGFKDHQATKKEAIHISRYGEVH